MSYFDKYFMRPIVGILNKNGPDLAMKVANPFTLHSFAKGNVSIRRLSGYRCGPTIRYHKSRAMGGY